MAVYNEESAHGIGHIAIADQLADSGAKVAQANALLCEFAHAPALGFSTGDDNVQTARLQDVKHFGQDCFVMLHVRVHDGEARSRASHHSLDAGRRQPTPPDAFQHSYMWIEQRARTDCIGSMVRGMIVHEDHFPVDPLKSRFKGCQKGSDVLPLFVSGYYYAKFEGASLNRCCRLRRQVLGDASHAKVSTLKWGPGGGLRGT